jgi:propanediol dehydratase large subunit
VFGFRPFAETWCGRLAMFGFAASIVGEATGKGGTLSQVGLEPSPELLTGLLATLGVALTVGTASTAAKLVQRKMTPK